MELKLAILEPMKLLEKTLVFLLIFLFSTTLFAGVEKFGDRKTMPLAGAELIVFDGKYDVMDLNPGVWQSQFSNKKVTNRVSLSIDNTNTTFQPDDYEATVEVKITYFKHNGTQFYQQAPAVTKTLVVVYDPANNYQDKSVFQFEGGHAMKVEVISITGISPGGPSDPQMNLVLEAEIDVERYYTFDPNAAITSSQLSHNFLTTRGELEVFWNFIPGAEEYDLEWLHVNNYDGSTSTPLLKADVFLDDREFEFNSTRITTSNTSYRIPLIYDQGYIVYRVRGVGRTILDNFEKDIPGVWISSDNSCTNTVDCYSPHVYSFVGHETSLNWQFTANYAEEGKSKVAVSYFDGSLRNRQVVSKINSDDSTIVGETIYDHQGRAAVQVLPTPTNSTKIEFTPKFNLNDAATAVPYSRLDFDEDNTACDAIAGPMSITSGSSNYYSPSNLDNLEHQAYVPDAKKYPFTQIEFTPDNTGRIRRQSGVGLDHVLGSDHETKYFYGTPSTQEELDRFFGSEVGYFNHYKKNMVIDANGQVSVSYLDPQGRVIATGLTGVAPLTLESLGNTVTSLTGDLLGKKSAADNRGVKNGLGLDGKSLVHYSEILVDTKKPRKFFYQMDGQKYIESCSVTLDFPDETSENKTDNFCYDCIFDLEISLTDECGTEFLAGVGGTSSTKTTVGQTLLDAITATSDFDPSTTYCEPVVPPYFNSNSINTNWFTNIFGDGTTQDLEIGNYSLNKKLTVNQDALDIYTQNYIDNNDCLLDLDYFTDWAIADIDFSGCNMDCDECITKLGDYEQYDVNVTPECDPCLSSEEYQDLIADCNEKCDDETISCEGALRMIMTDMGLDGQYGKIKLGNKVVDGVVKIPKPGAISPWIFPLSIFNENNVLPRKKGLIDADIVHPSWRTPYNPGEVTSKQHVYLDEDGEPVLILITPNSTGGNYTPAITTTGLSQVVTTSEGSFIDPQYLASVIKFIDEWDPSWARSLVVFHPEYGYYEYCIQIENSHQFDDDWMNVNEVSDFSNLPSSVDPLDPVATDPYFSSSNPVFSTSDPGFNAAELTNITNGINYAITNYGTAAGTTYTLLDMAYIIVNCPLSDQPACSTIVCTPPPGYNFDEGGSVDDDAVWNVYKGMYISLKQRFREQHRTRYAIRQTTYNGCIGDARFNPFTDGFYQTPRVIVSPFWDVPWSYLYIYRVYNSQYFNMEQPCSVYRRLYYREKKARFPSNKKMMGIGARDNSLCVDPVQDYGGYDVVTCTAQDQAILDEGKNYVDRASYLMCGQCPLTRDLEVLLAALVSNNELDISTSVPLSCYPNGGPGGTPGGYAEFTPTLEGALVAAGITAPYSLVKLGGSQPHFKTQFTGTGGTCNLELKFPASVAAFYTVANILEIDHLTYTTSPMLLPLTPVTVGGNNFSLEATVQINSSDPDYDGNYPTAKKVIFVEGLTSCINVGVCDFDPICAPSETAMNLQTLFNVLLFEDPTSTPAITANFISTSFSIDAGIFGAISKPLDEDFDAAIDAGVDDLNSDWTWNGVLGATANILNATISAPATQTGSCSLTFTVPLASGFIIADIVSFNNIKPDPIVSGDFTMTALVDDGTTQAYVEVTASSTCFDLGECGDELPSEFNRNGSSNPAGSGLECPVTQEALDLQDYLNIEGISGTEITSTSVTVNGCDFVIELPAFGGKFLEDIVSYSDIEVNQNFINDQGKSYHFTILGEFSNGEFIPLTGYSPCAIIGDCEMYSNFESFDLNFSDFNSDYSFDNSVCPGATTVGPTYNMVADASSCTTTSILDNSGTGSYMLLGYEHDESNSTPPSLIWEKTISTAPNTDYMFSMSYVDVQTTAGIDNIIGIEVDGSIIAWATIDGVIGTWETLSGAWKSVGSDDVSLKIKFLGSTGSDEDDQTTIGIDDIGFDIMDLSIVPCVASELTSNGDFPDDTDLTLQTPPATTDLTYDNTDCLSSTTQQQYSFMTKVLDPGCLTDATGNEHTGNAGMFMMINTKVYSSSTTKFVGKTINNIEPNTFYDFSVGYMNPNYYSYEWLTQSIELRVTGVGIGTALISDVSTPYGEDPGAWKQLKGQWYSGDTPPTSITIDVSGGMDKFHDEDIPQGTTLTCLDCHRVGESTLANLPPLYMGLDDISFIKKCPPADVMCDLPYMETFPIDTSCADQLLKIGIKNGETMYNAYINDVAEEFKERYIDKCLDVYEKFDMDYEDAEHHFTLYYYDQAGNLIRTIPPNGVEKVTASADFEQIKVDRADNTRTFFTEHTYETTYQYNSLNQLVSQSVPDHNNLEIWSTENVTNPGVPAIPIDHTIYGTEFTDGRNGFAHTEDPLGDGHIYITDDGGETWTEITSIGIMDLNAVQYAPSSPLIAFAVGKEGTVVKSVDGGETWIIKTIPTTGELVGLIFISDLVGNVYEKNGDRWSTSDGGDMWSVNSNLNSAIGSGNLTGIEGDPRINGKAIAVSDNGVIKESSDNGNTWVAGSPPVTPVALNSVQKVNLGSWFSIGEDGTLLKSTNLGDDWTEISNNLTAELVKFHFRTDLIGCVIDANGSLYKTLDGGNVWTQISRTLSTTSITGMKDLSFISETDGFAVNGTGFVIKTVNGGASWDEVSPDPALTAITTIYFKDGDYGFIGGLGSGTSLNNKLYLTIDGGATFNPVGTITSLPVGATIKDIYFTTVLPSGWLINTSLILDNGQVWHIPVIDEAAPLSAAGYWTDLTLTAPLSSGTPFSEFHFTSSSSGHLLGAGGNYYTSTDGAIWSAGSSITTSASLKGIYVDGTPIAVGGVAGSGEIWELQSGTWTLRSSTITPSGLNGVSYASDGLAVYATGVDGTVLHSPNLGTLDFQTQLTGTSTNLNAIAADATGEAVAVGDGGMILETSNAGVLWTINSSAGTTNNLQTVEYATVGSKFYAAGDNCSAYSTTTIGGTWSQETTCVSADGFRALAIHPTASGELLGVGDNGKIFQKEGSSGSGWTMVTDIHPPVIKDAYMIDTQNGYGVGENGNMLVTNDGGHSWEPQTSGLAEDLNSVYFIDVNKGIAVGNTGTILVTTDRGVTWDAQTSGTSNLNDVFIIKSTGKAVVVGDGGKVLVNSAPFAAGSWSAIGSLPTDHLQAVYFVDETFGYAVGQSGGMLKATLDATVWTPITNGGTDWATSTTTVASTFRDVYFVDYVTGYAIGDDEIMLKTINGGATWTLEIVAPQAGNDLLDISFTDNYNAYISGTGTDGNVTALYDFTDQFSTLFFYDRLGRLVASQNAKQHNKTAFTYSYTEYDEFGRITDVGELAATHSMNDNYINRTLDDDRFTNFINSGDKAVATVDNSGIRTEVTQTFYDNVAFSGLPVTQENLKTRVASVTYKDVDLGTTAYNHSTHYSYDIHGNVDVLLQDNPDLASISHQYKTIHYIYDLVSGNVIEVQYQKGSTNLDQFYHRYEYDADNRITNVMTSKDGIIWDQDAKYFYYEHGPLERVELADEKVQGIDYAYTIQGWLKGVNSNTMDKTRDIGKDGLEDLVDYKNKNVPEDEYGYTLGYYAGDYSAINTGIPVADLFVANQAGSTLETNPVTNTSGVTQNLYNGNISTMVTAIRQFMQGGTAPQGMSYQYDQLNRIRTATMHNNLDMANNTWQTTGGATTDYKVDVSYDANGNILSLDRKAVIPATGSDNKMDEMTYFYATISKGFAKNTNKLRAVRDAGDNSVTTAFDDIKTGQDTSMTDPNYQYDEIGNLIKDKSEEIDNIEWTVYGKVKKVIRTDASTLGDLEFKYDANGNRIAKISKPDGSSVENGGADTPADWTITYYVRDASGNTMATYKDKEDDPDFWLEEQYLYGSSRLGLKNRNLNLTTSTTPDIVTRDIGEKQYELSNHLGNVLATVSDRRSPEDDDADDIIDFYTANLTSANNYYPFGMIMPRQAIDGNTDGDYDDFGDVRPNLNTNSYKYGFNGMEKDDEVQGNGNTYDYGFRIYNPRLGKFLSVDPLHQSYPWYSPYHFAGNTPIWAIDLDGLEEDKTNKGPLFDKMSEAKVMIDPGHGDKPSGKKWLDGGAVSNPADSRNKDNLQEKDLALKVAKAIEKHMKAVLPENTTITRDGDVTPSSKKLVWRIEKADEVGANIFISVHLNSAGRKVTDSETQKETIVVNKEARGFVVLFQSGDGNTKSKELATQIAKNQSTIPLIGDGTKTQNLYVTRAFKGDAAVLIEVGFITNKADAKAIVENFDQIGKEIATGIISFIIDNSKSIAAEPEAAKSAIDLEIEEIRKQAERVENAGSAAAAGKIKKE